MPAYPRASAGRRGPAGAAGPASEWRTSGGFIQVRPVGGTSWTNVVSLTELTSTVSAQGFNFKGEVADAGSLPASGNTAGDAYFITGTADLYVWDGTAWTGPTSLQGPAGNDGAAGADGADGAAGPAGPGLPTGGTAGQVPVKASGTDYDVEWADPPTGIPTGATEGEVLTYQSGDVVWSAGGNLHMMPVWDGSGDHPTRPTLPAGFYVIWRQPTAPLTDAGYAESGDEWGVTLP